MLGLAEGSIKHGHACGVKLCMYSGRKAPRTAETQPATALWTASIQVTSLTALHCICDVSTVLLLRHDTDVQATYNVFPDLDFSFLCSQPGLHRAFLSLLLRAV